MEKRIGTLINHPDKVARKYGRKVWCRLLYMGKVRPLGNENYDQHWNYTSFKGKTVLDLGADYGSTTDYFLRHGAAKVASVEGNTEYARRLFARFGGDDRTPCIHMWIRTGNDIDLLVNLFKPDVVKVDIEGDEKLLLETDVARVREWLVETHTEQLRQQVSKFFLQSGFKVSVVEYGKTEGVPEIKVLVCTMERQGKVEQIG